MIIKIKQKDIQMFNITIARPAPKVNPAKELAVEVAKGIAITVASMVVSRAITWIDEKLSSKTEDCE